MTDGPSRVYDLADLIKLNGFDSGGTSFNTDTWVEYVTSFQTTIPIGSSNSIFGFGCGCGAFLMPFYDKGHAVGRVDYSEVLISIAKLVWPRPTCYYKNLRSPLGIRFMIPFWLIVVFNILKAKTLLELFSAKYSKSSQKSRRTGPA